MILAHFFVTDTQPLLFLSGEYDLALVALSVFVAVVAGIMALQLAALARTETRPWNRQGLVISGAAVLGSGVWSMHFIGMLAFSACSNAHYDPLITILSMLPSFLASWVALILLSRDKITRWQLLTSGVCVGAGIGIMHYSGMMAVYQSLDLRFDPPAFALSIVVAVALSVLSLWLRFGLGLSGRLSAQGITVISGAVLGIAISGMHYTGMTAARFVVLENAGASEHSNTTLALSIAGIAILASVITGGLNMALRYRTLYRRMGQNEARLRTSEQQYRSLIGNLPGVAFRCRVDGDWSMLFISDAVERLTGWTAQDFLDGVISFGRLLHPDDRDWTAQSVGEALDQDRPYQIEYRIIDRDGIEHWVSESASGVRGPDGTIRWIDGIIIDVTDTKTRNAEFEGIATALNRSLAVIEFDLNGIILRANPTFLGITGYGLEELVGRHHSVLCLPSEVNAPAYRRLWETLRHGEFTSGEFHRIGKQGQDIWINGSYNPILDPQGRPYKIIKFASDLSERHAMEQDLRDAKAKAEQASAAKGTFLANMSHEIRTPMNAIIGFTEVLLAEPVTDSQRRHLNTVRTSARALLVLLNDILDTAKLERGAVELEIKDFSLREVCIQVLASLRVTAQTKDLALVLDYSDDQPEFFQGDSLRIQQILLNLVGNAVKFTQTGEVRVVVSVDQGRVHMVIIDSGIGIAADRIDAIFAPFSQADASMTRRFGGTGLGTTIARQLVDLMDGRIWVESTLGKGSRFHVELPLPRGQAVDAAQDQAAIDLPPLKFLVADDVPQNLELLHLMLGRFGHSLTLTANGEEALRAFQDQRFDIVLMDVQMPVMNGLDASRAIRAWETEKGLSPTPIIALTASVLEEDVRATQTAGMDGFASKPVDLYALSLEIARLLRLEVGAPLPSPTSSTLPAVRGSVIDWAQGQRLWGNEPRHRQAVHKFLSDFTHIVTHLRGHLADAGELAAKAHRLKGAAGNLALSRVAHVCTTIEQAANDGTLDTIPALLDRLADEWMNVEEAAGHAAPQAASTVASAAPMVVDSQRLRPILTRLEDALAHGELDESALEHLAQLLPRTDLAPLDDAINAFDFDAARQVSAALMRTYCKDETSR